ncbi:MAG: hypothetical protein Kow00121_59710 [Elainellaceae cyanobacterium]
MHSVILTQEQLEQAQHCLPMVTIAPICGNCAEFLASELAPATGTCLLHEVAIGSGNKACSQYYQNEPFEPAGDDDEF